MPEGGDRVRVSVVLCTHDPHPGRLERTLEGLAAQTLETGAWELVIVDNASDPPVERRRDLAALPFDARVVDEPELGLTPARLRGVEAARGDVLVLVDDDNVLAPDYLERGLALMDAEPEVGAAGGIVDPEYEVPPGRWAEPFVNLLGVRDPGPRPMRVLMPGRAGPWEPIGAGMVLRRRVALDYAAKARRPPRSRLDRAGGSLASCGDTDLARCALDLGLYEAYEPSLRLTHLIPAGRVSFGYLLRLCYHLKRSGMILDRIRGSRTAIRPASAWARAALAPLRAACRSPRQWALRTATNLGELRGLSVDLESP